jgi:hypothetical protein
LTGGRGKTSRTVGQTTHTFSYNSENRLRLIQQGMSSVEFAYDGLGRRISRTVSSGMSATTTHFFYDGDRVINEITGSAPYVDAYRYGVGLIRRNNEWPLFDSQGNTRLVTNANQAVSASVVYDAFGNVTYSSGSTSVRNRYCGDWGYRDDGDAGLLHVGARYYDPTTGRFTTRDSLLTEHPYVYCDGDPVNAVDPSGQLPASQHLKDLIQFATPNKPLPWLFSLLLVPIGIVASGDFMASPSPSPGESLGGIGTGLGTAVGGAGLVAGAAGALGGGGLVGIGAAVVVGTGIGAVIVGAAAVGYGIGKLVGWW